MKSSLTIEQVSTAIVLDLDSKTMTVDTEDFATLIGQKVLYQITVADQLEITKPL